jgi:hypothetical protein
MGLAEAIEENRFKGGEVCTVVTLYEKLSKEDKEAFDNALKNNVATQTICLALRAEGFKLGEPTLNVHRRGQCRCATKK